MIKIDEQSFCESCFEKTDSYPCPRCGFAGNDEKRNAVALAKGTILQGRYIIGKMLGKGGFGITYLAYDYKNKCRVAIKEYFPNGIIYRQPGQTRAEAYDDKTEILEDGAEKFYQEAKTVSKFHKNENIITVYEFFKENNTSYFVMEYLDGVDLKTYVEKRGVLSEGEMKAVLYAAVNVLGEIHDEGILHRDLSPDNIFVCNDGRIMFLDFGAARQLIAEKSQSMSIILKQGFAPFEQYQRKSNQGPWSDIYAMGATAYFAMFGAVPDDAISRVSSPELQIPDKYSVSIPMRAILNKMLAVFPESRYQSAAELKADLDGNNIVPIPLIPIGKTSADSTVANPIITPPSVGSSPVSEDFNTFRDNSGNSGNGGTIPDAPKDDGDDEEKKEDKKEKSSKKGLLIGIISALVLALVIVIVLFCLKTCSSDSSGGSGSGSGTGTGVESDGTSNSTSTDEDPGVVEWIDPRDSVVFVESSFTLGTKQSSGFAIGNPSEKVQYFVTTCHTVYDEISNTLADEVWIHYSYSENDKVKAQIVEKDIEKDIAVLKIQEPTDKRKALVICESDKVKTGDSIRTSGYPMLKENNYTEFSKNDIAIDDGTIKKIDTIDGKGVYFVSASISNGNSGGPLTNEKGEVIGINSFKYIISPDGITAEELKYAIQIDELLPLIDNYEINYVLSKGDGSENDSGKPEDTKNPTETYPQMSELLSSLFSVNNDDYGYVTSDKEQFTEGETITVTAVAKKGYEFKQWNDGDTNAQKTVIANFERDYIATFEAKTMTVTLKSDTTQTMTVRYGEIYGTLPTLSKAGFVFAGWYDSQTGGNKILPESVVSADSDHTLYARFETASLVSLMITSTNHKIGYISGEKLDVSGLAVVGVYSDGSEKQITGFTTSPAANSTLTTSTNVTISYEGKTVEYYVSVTAEKVSSISITSSPSKTSYFEGDTLSTSGLSIKVTYNNGRTETVSSNIATTPANGTVLSADNKKLVVNYGGKTTSVALTVTPIAPASIEIYSMPNKTSYYEGDRFNIAGLKIRVTNNNGSSSVISSGFTTNPANRTVLSTSNKKITVTYEGKTASFNITVSPVAVSSISIASTPKTEYFNGDKLDISGLSINVIYNNGRTELLQTGFTTTPANGATLNMQNKTLTVSYGGKTTSISLNIKDVAVTYIEIETFPTKTSYTVGDKFSSSGLSIRAHYNNGTNKKITSGFTVSVSDGTVLTAGTKTVTVTYQGKTDSFKITTVQPDKCSINVEAQPSEGGTVTGGGEYVKGSSITIKATPKAGYVFDGWYNGNTRVSTSKNYTFTLNSDYPNMVARFSIKPYTYTDNTERTIDDAGFYGTSFRYMDELNMSEYKQFMNAGYEFIFEIEMEYEEMNDGVQEIYIYNSNKTSGLLDPTENTAKSLGKLAGKSNINAESGWNNPNGKYDHGTENLTFNINGSQMNEKMYVRYDAHGELGESEGIGNDWKRISVKVTVTVKKVG